MDEKILTARIGDLENRAEKTDKPQFLGFLSEGESAIALERLGKSALNVKFFGGYEGAGRNFLCVAPKFCENPQFPIAAVTARYRKQDKLSHRDFLGSLMALGLTREKIGDILVEDGRAVFFAEKTVSDFIVSQINKVGRVGVTLKIGADYPLPEIGKKQEFSSTVSSSRLDCVIAAILNTSRNKALEVIEQSLVSVNSFLTEKPTLKINSGDKISVRRKGRFDIISIDEISKKGRIILRYEKYF